MKTFAINTLGCKVNQYESQQIRELLEQLGLRRVETADKPDLVVVNTCCVTHTASGKSRQHIRKAQKLNPDVTVVVCGCLPGVQLGELNNIGDNVHLISPQSTVAGRLSQIVNDKTAALECEAYQPYPYETIRTQNASKIKGKMVLAGQKKLPPLTSFQGQTRAFLKVQDGCDRRCTYCIIPKARPNLQSKPAELALQETEALVAAGHREIVVTGIFLGAYSQKSARRKNWDRGQNDKLADLLDEMAQIPNLARIRLSSLEPADVTDRLLDTFCKSPNIMPHLHLSLQSGADAVLRRMARQYRAKDFLRTVEKVKSRLDKPAITTDIIVGFPGETDADFDETVDLARQVGFAKMHVFAFSAREGTAAARMINPVAPAVIKHRSKILRELDIELGRKYREQFIGQTAAILIETNNGQLAGRSERYFTVNLEKEEPHCKKNDLVTVRLTKASDNGAIGILTDT